MMKLLMIVIFNSSQCYLGFKVGGTLLTPIHYTPIQVPVEVEMDLDDVY